MSKYDELFLPADDMWQMTIEAREKRRSLNLQWLSSQIKYQAKDGKFSTTVGVDCCQFVTDEDWEGFKNRGYHITFNANDTITISWE